MDQLTETLNDFRSKGVRKTLILCDKEMLRLGHTHDVINALLAKQMHYYLFSDTLLYPQENVIKVCKDKMVSERLDSIIAIGGNNVLEVNQILLKSLEMEYPAGGIQVSCV